MKKTSKKLIVLSEVDSTNNYAKRLIEEGSAEHYTVVLAHYQTKGRGQEKNMWVSEPNKNILASMVLYPSFLPAEMQFYLSKVVSLALSDALIAELPDHVVKIKWPNDIYVDDRKIAGILIENYVVGNKLSCCVIGTGININQTEFPDGLPNPVSLKQLSGKEYEPEKLLEQIIERNEYWYNQLQQMDTLKIDHLFRERLYRFNEWAHFRTGKGTFEGQIIGTDSYGRLLISDRNRNISKYMLKEIEFLI